MSSLKFIDCGSNGSLIFRTFVVLFWFVLLLGFAGPHTSPCWWYLRASGCLSVREASGGIPLPVPDCSNILACEDKGALHTMSLAVIESLFLVPSTLHDVSGSEKKVPSHGEKEAFQIKPFSIAGSLLLVLPTSFSIFWWKR